MNRVSLNTALLSFAFTGVLPPHRGPEVPPPSRELATLRAHTLNTESRARVEPAGPIEPQPERAKTRGSVWVGALAKIDRH